MSFYCCDAGPRFLNSCELFRLNVRQVRFKRQQLVTASYLTSASGLLSWLLGIQLSIGSLWEAPDVPFPAGNLCFFSFFPAEEEDDGAEEGTLPLVALWPRGEELSVVALLLAFL